MSACVSAGPSFAFVRVRFVSSTNSIPKDVLLSLILAPNGLRSRRWRQLTHVASRPPLPTRLLFVMHAHVHSSWGNSLVSSALWCLPLVYPRLPVVRFRRVLGPTSSRQRLRAIVPLVDEHAGAAGAASGDALGLRVRSSLEPAADCWPFRLEHRLRTLPALSLSSHPPPALASASLGY